MPDGAIDLRPITTARTEFADARAEATAAAAERAAVAQELTARVGAGEGGEPVRVLERRIEALSDQERTALGRADALGNTIADLSDAIRVGLDPEAAVASLDGGLPIALLPVRIETRFADDKNSLRIRIYPDQIHIDAHEPELTSDEVAAGTYYWTARWSTLSVPAEPDDATATQAWQAIASRFRPERAAWIVETMRPTNLPEPGAAVPDAPTFPEPPTKAAPWTRARRAIVLPDRWVAVGRRAGAEIFRVWTDTFLPDELAVTPSPGTDAEDRPEPEPGATPLDEPMRWIADPQAATEKGVLLTVTDDDVTSGRLQDGIDELYVVGVDWTLSPEHAAGSLGGLLGAHAHSDGLAFVAAGTPTNNSSGGRSGAAPPPADRARALDPARPPDALDDQWSASRRLRRALGLGPEGAVLDRVPGAAGHEQRVASALIDALWAGTAGYYLGDLLDPFLTATQINNVRLFAAASLFPGGPLPTMRVGAQPYGVLPVVAPTAFRPAGGNATVALVADAVRRIRVFWTEAVARVPRLGSAASADDLDAAMLAVLQQSPVASTAHFRRVYGTELSANLAGLDDLAGWQGFANAVAIWRMAGAPFSKLPKLASYVTDPTDYPLPVPWSMPEKHEPTEGLQYLATIDGLVATSGRRDLEARENASTILEALLSYAAAKEVEATEHRVVRRVAESLDLELPDRVAVETPELVNIVNERAVASGAVASVATGVDVGIAGLSGAVGRVRDAAAAATATPADRFTFTTSKQLSEAVIPELSATEPVGTYVVGQLSKFADLFALIADPDFGGIGRVRAALQFLGTEPAGAVDWSFRSVLGAYTHRLDAWCTALATNQLDALRAARPDGVHVGCYGYVEGLRPDRAADSLGYVHTPSLTHAATASILRSGHLAHRDAEHEALAIDLSADRVRAALTLIEGVAEGQSIAALVGYRIERSVRDRDIRLARFILPLRLLAPLRHRDVELDEPEEAIAARDVVDGIALLDKWKDNRQSVLDGIHAGGNDAAAIGELLDQAAALYDAVADVLVSEAVFQTARGNFERAGAALAMLDRQQRPLDPEFVRTPRSGATVAHRVVVVFPDENSKHGWNARRDLRALVDPRLDAWAARLFGPPEQLRFRGVITEPDGTVTVVTADARDLGLSALSLALSTRSPGSGSAGTSAGAGRPSELDERVARILAAKADRPGDEATLTLSLEPPDDGDDGPILGLGAVRTIGSWIASVAAGRRALDAGDLAAVGNAADPDDVTPGVDLADLQQRADLATTALDTAHAAVAAAANDDPPDAGALRDALDLAGALGMVEALPLTTADDDEARAVLHEQAIGVAATLAVVKAGVATAAADFPAAQAARATEDDAAAKLAQAELLFHTEQIHRVLGGGFPVVPRFVAANASELGASLAERDALTLEDDLAPLTWLHRMALVRPELDQLASLLTTAEGLGRELDLPNLDLAQVPHRPGQRWSALPLGDTAAPSHGPSSIVVHAAGGFDPEASLAGVVVDAWTETIPATHDTTGVSFHYDAPAARAPQCVVLAVPPDITAAHWDFDTLLATVQEVFALARLRAVTPKELLGLGGYLPATYLPDNFTADVPTVSLFHLAAKFATLDASVLHVMGKS